MSYRCLHQNLLSKCNFSIPYRNAVHVYTESILLGNYLLNGLCLIPDLKNCVYQKQQYIFDKKYL